MIELLHKRTFTQKTFDLGNGSKRLNAHIGHIHYRDGALKNGSYSDIDTTLNYNSASQSYAMTAASYETEVGLFGDITFHNVDTAVSFILANKSSIQATAYDGSAFGRLGKGLIWRNILGANGHQIVEARNGALAKIFRFESKPATNVITFQVSVTGGAKLLQDNVELKPMLQQARTTGILNLEYNGRLTWLRPPRAWNHRGEQTAIELRWFKSGAKLYIDKIIPQSFIDATFTEAGAWLECDTTTSYYAGAGDGMCQRYDGVPATWQSIREYANSQFVSRTTLYAYSSPYPVVDRIFIPINTNGIVGIISSAILYTSSPGQAELKTRDVCLIQTTQADPTELTVDDYSRLTLNSPDEGATRKAESDWAVNNTYYDWSLNPTGLSWINKTGYTLLGIRDSGDVDNETIAPATDSGIRLNGEWSDYDPYLDVTYSDGFTAVPPIADVTDGSWLNEVGSQSNLYASIDELTPSDTDYVYTTAYPSDTFEVRLSGVSDPRADNLHTVYYRYQMILSGLIDLTVGLYQGASLIYDYTASGISSAWTSGQFTLPTASAANITDYSDLRLRFTATKR